MHATNNRYTLFFGDQKTSFEARAYQQVHDGAALAQALFGNHPDQPEYLVMQKQTHSAQGYALSSPKDLVQYAPYTHEGDYLITNQRGVAVGVATADCMPLIMYDPKNHALAAIHAGWRGAHQQIALAALEHLRTTYGTAPEHVRAHIGPCARACCYAVQESFIQEIPAPYTQKHAGAWYCDLVAYQQDQLTLHGVPHEQIMTTSALCTICDTRFCSYRRDKEKARRQITYAVLL